jgi:hypothetical protein
MGLASLEAVQVLRATWVQQFYLDGGQVRWRDQQAGLPPGSRVIPEPLRSGRPRWRQTRPHLAGLQGPPHRGVRARPAPPGSRTWPPPTPPPPTWTPCQGRHRDLAAADLLPDVHLVDAGYVSVGQVLAADDDHGVQLTGPLPPDTSFKAGDHDAFDLTRFTIDDDAQRVVCPTARSAGPGRRPAAATACRSSGPPSASRTVGPAPTGPAAPARRTTPAT